MFPPVLPGFSDPGALPDLFAAATGIALRGYCCFPAYPHPGANSSLFCSIIAPARDGGRPAGPATVRQPEWDPGQAGFRIPEQ